MGAWGTGMLDNDNAGDAIGRLMNKPYINEHFSKAHNAEEVLGLAKFLNDQRVQIPRESMQIIEDAFEEEGSEDVLSRWKNVGARRSAIHKFYREIHG